LLSVSPLRWLVFADECGLAARIAARLQDLGQRVFLVRCGTSFSRTGHRTFSLRAGVAEDYDELLKALGGAGEAPDIILHAWTVTSCADAGEPEVSERTLDIGFYSLLFLT